VNSNIIEHVEDIHLMLEHMIVKALREQVYEEKMTELVLETVEAPREI
jgi:hypothetical protein